MPGDVVRVPDGLGEGSELLPSSFLRRTPSPAHVYGLRHAYEERGS